MANDRLRTALLQRGVTPAELADAAGVDPKTVERWIGGRIPYRRHRYLVATRLQADEASPVGPPTQPQMHRGSRAIGVADDRQAVRI